MTQEEPIPVGKPRLLALGAFGLWVAAAAAGPQIGFEGHSAFLFGAGDLPADAVAAGAPHRAQGGSQGRALPRLVR